MEGAASLQVMSKLTPLSRRSFVTGASLASAGVAAVPEFARNDNLCSRSEAAFKLRVKRAAFYRDLAAAQATNGDEGRHAGYVANFSKALRHNNLGEVDPGNYHALLEALSSGSPAEFDAIPLGGAVKLSNPQAALAFDLQGYDSHQLPMPAPPAFASNWQAAEMIELYWQALTRDVPFASYATDTTIQRASRELSSLLDLAAPREAGQITPQTIFRASFPEALTGPYVSQLLYLNVPYGDLTQQQKYLCPQPSQAFMTTYPEWLSIQRGLGPNESVVFLSQPRYLTCARDLAEFVHRDFVFQAMLNACLIATSFGAKALNSTNPYLASVNQSGFATFGAPCFLDLMSRAANSALKAAWFQKWVAHRRIRPEEFGGRVHNTITGQANYPIAPLLFHSTALDLVRRNFSSALLPQAYPEGCPTHPSYPAGHAIAAGACATVLKALFNESFVLPNPVMPVAEGSTLVPDPGAPSLTLGGEINKLAANLALGRDAAGVHWRSDSIQGMLLGEKVATGILRDYAATFNEEFKAFQFHSFDGTETSIGAEDP
jgi:membrane-associated phospholipid phosphatase